MKTLEQFWDAIGMDETVRRAAAAAERETDAAKAQPACELLLHEDTAKRATGGCGKRWETTRTA